MGELTTDSTPGGSTPAAALDQTSEEVARTIRTLRRHNLVVKVLSHGAPHLEDARG